TRVLIETRGEGGFVVVAPSGGTVHPSGRSWKPAPHAAPGWVVTLAPGARDALHAVATLLDEMPAPAPQPAPAAFARPATGGGGGKAPGDDYNERGSWHALLIPHGWQPVSHGSTPDRQYWTRPGKDTGTSAVTGGAQGDFFWCWSTSTELPAEQAMSKWRVYALLEHGGDFHAAAKALRQQGYGQPEFEFAVFGFKEPASIPVANNATPPTATGDELLDFLNRFTRYRSPARLGRRVAWMKSDPHQLYHHTCWLVSDAIDGHYPATRAVDALADTYRAAGGTDPNYPRQLLSVALGAVLAAKVSAA
ncbi:MAG: hypothetical protein ACRDS1_15495, partial [Pseudonocardiaceae bacterium]